ncbi:MAG: hypothetical protein IJA07_03710 [Agathobacter sp.]|nr:hypothetical protein [Agathobacter sp.]
MLEVYVLVEKQKTLVMKILTIFCFVIGAYFMYATLMGLIIYFAIAIPFFALGWFLHTRSLEYEYSYFDGDFRFAKIISKQKRKELIGYEAENVIVIAPKGDRSLYQYEKNPQVKTRDLTSGQKDVKVYAMVSKVEEGLHMTLFEPDEKYLDAVCIKYRQKVIR